ncbi:MAG: NAD(+) synthase [Slackia sp.]|nr:NAD(+) synthase [Slackia sp.]
MHIGEKYGVCVDGLASFAHGIGMGDAVIGLSGGIDSSLVACMCVDVFGADHVHGYMLPGPYSSEHSLVDAQELAFNLGMRAERISIDKPFEAFVDVLGDHCIMARGLAAENTQARCRMVVLMALSNAHGWMMVNTGNKSEAMMGYSTLYGDTAGAFAPIGGLYKTDVFAMSRWVNEKALAEGRVAPIPEHVLIKPPSAELAPDQRDEDTLGSYAELDGLLIDYAEHGMGREELVAAGYNVDEVRRVTGRVDAYAFKRALEPPFPVIEY